VQEMQPEDKDDRGGDIGQHLFPLGKGLPHRRGPQPQKAKDRGHAEREEKSRDDEPALRPWLDPAFVIELGHADPRHVGQVERHHGQDTGREERDKPREGRAAI
jgi:hypothetical protein